MRQDHIGLFDTPPSRHHVRFALAVLAILSAAFVLVLPFGDLRLPSYPGLVTTIDAALLVCELVIVAMLCSLASTFRSRALAILAAGNLFTGLLYASHALTYPGAFAPDGLLGAGVNTTSWLAQFRRAGLPIAVCLYVFVRRREPTDASERTPAPIGAALLVAVALAVAVTVFATAGHDWLPTVFRNRLEVIHPHALLVEGMMFTFFAATLILLYVNRSSLLDLWLLTSGACWLLQSLMIMTLLARNTAGFYALLILIFSSHLILLLALIGETARIHARLALATAARNRERDARLMSTNAVAAAISHEIGQPLTAISLNARAALSWLSHKRPDIARAADALRATIEAGNRANEAVKSVRSILSQRRGKATLLSINDLIRDTAHLLSQDLLAEKASLQFALDDALPLIRADRLQLQLVLINLFANAMDSLGAIKARPRIITIRTATVEYGEVLIEFSDNGAGIDPDRVERIFDAFYTTKPSGTGLGLSLCRTIVEGHGGRLWASPDAGQGATFHILLPNDLRAAA